LRNTDKRDTRANSRRPRRHPAHDRGSTLTAAARGPPDQSRRAAMPGRTRNGTARHRVAGGPASRDGQSSVWRKGLALV